MSDLTRRLEQARGHIQLDWTPERVEHNRRAVLRRERRRQAARATLAALILVGIFVAAGRAWLRPGEKPGPAPIAKREAPRLPIAPQPIPPAPLWTRAGAAVRFRDGSQATLLSADTRLYTREDTPGRTVVKLEGGGARFDVVHDPARVFRVETPAAAIEVLGTRFNIERIGYGVAVAVEHGHVRVLWAGGAADLTDGQHGVFPPRRAAEHGVPARAAPAASARDWRALAAEGQFESAYLTLERGPLSEVSDEPGDLLILADVARLSRHPAQAVPPLSKVVDAHPGDPRAPLAAFTMGRVLLDDLGRPQQAADAFARAQALDPSGPLAEDALAREVEAWSRADDPGRARARAEQYVQRYPGGRRLRSVRRYGGLD